MRYFLLPVLVASACSAVDPCERTAREQLRSCVDAYSARTAVCLADTDASCADDDAEHSAALDRIATELEAQCDEGLFGLSVDATIARVQTSCASESDSLAWRSFGGPQAAVWGGADEATRSCLTESHATSTRFVSDTLQALDDCADCSDLAATRASLANEAQTAVTLACPSLSSLIAVDPSEFIDRAALQADCIAATVHGNGAELGLDCGPSNARFDVTRGEWTQVIVDQEEWGSVCGDGSDYAFWIRPAPEGAPLENVLIGLQGGGVCVFEDDCVPRFESSPGLFTAMDDEPYSLALVSDDPAVSPFADWTKVYLPYCNQDVFAGGGAVEQLGELSLPRAGGVNLRAALRMSRDVLWREIDAEGEDGFRPDQIVALFGGWSAGSYGTLYNLHWVLDDLQWPRTVSFPDAGLALDNEALLGVRALGDVKIPLWGTKPNLPPYCFDGSCAVSTVLLEALSPRLLQVPEQQILMVSNPRDQVQQADSYFSDEAFFVNTMRSAYCSTKTLPGVHWYLTSVSDESVHVVTLRDDLWVTEVAGQTMRDWFDDAVNAPDTLQSRAEEANFVADIPGVEPFPCEVAP